MQESLFSVKEFGLYFNGKLVAAGAKDEVALDVTMDFDLSKGNALTFSNIQGVEGTVTKVTLGTSDLTADIAEGAVSCEAIKSSGELGVKTLTIETDTTIYTLEVTVASYVITNTADMLAWKESTTNYGNDNVVAQYVVVANSFEWDSELGSFGSYFLLANGWFKGTIDGRGNVIDKMVTGGPMFAGLKECVVKDIAFTNIKMTEARSGNGVICRWLVGAHLSNVYVSGTAVNDASNGQYLFGTGASTYGSTITNCVFNVANLAATGSADLFGTDGMGGNDTTLTNVYAISESKTMMMGNTANVYASATEDFFNAVSTNMQESLFSTKDGKLYFNEKELF
jgi:hypothetical protein